MTTAFNKNCYWPVQTNDPVLLMEKYLIIVKGRFHTKFIQKKKEESNLIPFLDNKLFLN